jgi:hypothetical protein
LHGSWALLLVALRAGYKRLPVYIIIYIQQNQVVYSKIVKFLQQNQQYAEVTGKGHGGLTIAYPEKKKKTRKNRRSGPLFVKYHKMFIFMSEFGHIQTLLLSGII